MKQGDFDRQCDFDQSGSFVKGATVMIQKFLFVAKLMTDVWTCIFICYQCPAYIVAI